MVTRLKFIDIFRVNFPDNFLKVVLAWVPQPYPDERTLILIIYQEVILGNTSECGGHKV